MPSDKKPRYKAYRNRVDFYTVDYPAHWKPTNVQKEQFLVFQPKTRQDVFVRIETLPYSVDIEIIGDKLQSMFSGVLSLAKVQEISESNLLHYPSASGILVAQNAKMWVTAHDDLFLLISVSNPSDLDHIYQPIFERMLTSLRIDRKRQVNRLRLLMKVASRLQEVCPEGNFKVSGYQLANDRIQLSVENLERQIARQPNLSESLIEEMVSSVADVHRMQQTIGQETWEQVSQHVFPMIRPDSIHQASQLLTNKKMTPEDLAQSALVSSPWLVDLVVCYAIDSDKSFRMILQTDLDRWNLDESSLHEQALQNLIQRDLPKVSVVTNPLNRALIGGLGEGGLSAKSSYLLHPDLYKLLRPTFGQEIWVAIPNRDSLMLFSKSDTPRDGLLRAVEQDFKSSNHKISDRLFILTPDGVVLG